MLSEHRHDHDATKNDATWDASMVADGAARSFFTPSKTFIRSPIPATILPLSSARRNNSYRANSPTPRVDRTMNRAAGRPRSLSRSSSSSAASNSKIEHSPLITRSSTSLRASPKSPFHARSAPTVIDLTRCKTAPDNSTIAVPLTANTLSPRARKRLMRSTRKLSKILGETPIVLSPTLTHEVFAVDNALEAEFGMLQLPVPKNGGSQQKYRSAGRHLVLNFGRETRAQTVPTRHPNGAPAMPSSPRVAARTPADVRGLPVLKLDCSATNGSGKRTRLSANGPSSDENDNADNISLISTLTTDTSTGNLLVRSPLSPVSVHNAATRFKQDALEARRSKIAKLSRTLGEPVPTELVFPPGSIPGVSSPLTTALPLSPLGNLPALLGGISVADANDAVRERRQVGGEDPDFVLPPPRQSSLLRRRRHRSLQLVSLGEAESGSNSNAGTVAPENTPISGSRRNASSSRSANRLIRSHSSRGRGPSKYGRSSARTSASRSHAASVVKSLNSSQVGARPLVDARVGEVSLSGLDDELKIGDYGTVAVEKAMLPQSSPSSRRLSVGGTTLVKVPSCGEQLLIPQDKNRLSTHSIMSIVEGQDKPLPLIASTSSSNESASGSSSSNAAGTCTSLPNDKKPDATQTTYDTPPARPSRRRISLSDFPPTPPPFSHYFQTAAQPNALVLDSPNTAPAAATVTTSSTAVSSSIPALSLPPYSPLSPISSEISSSPSIPDTPPKDDCSNTSATGTVDSTTFRERRLRAAKLARFFGVECSDLLPALGSDTISEKDETQNDTPNETAVQQQQQQLHDKKASRVSRSLDLAVPRTIRLMRMSRSFDRSTITPTPSVEPLLPRERRSLSPVFSSSSSYSKPRGAYGQYGSHSRGSSRSTMSGFGSLDGVSVVVQREVDAWVLPPAVDEVASSTMSNTTATPVPTPPRVVSPSPIPEDMDSQYCREGDMSYRVGASRSPTPSMMGRRRNAFTTLTLGRKGSLRVREMVEGGDVSASGAAASASSKNRSGANGKVCAPTEWTWRDSEPSFVRVGEKPADRQDVINLLRELR